MAVEDIVAKDQGHIVVADELFTDQKCLRQAIGARLNCVVQQ